MVAALVVDALAAVLGDELEVEEDVEEAVGRDLRPRVAIAVGQDRAVVGSAPPW